MIFTASTLSQHSHPGPCSSWRAPGILWTQLRHRSSPENWWLPPPLYGGQTGGSLRSSPKGSQLQLASLIIKYMLLGSVSWFEEENRVHWMSLWVHIIPCEGNTCCPASHRAWGSLSLSKCNGPGPGLMAQMARTRIPEKPDRKGSSPKV